MTNLNIQKIRADFPILRGKFSIALFLSLSFYACNQKSKKEKIVIVANENNKPDLQIKVSKSDLVYSDSILKVYVDKNISFIDSFPIIKRFSNEIVYYHNNYF
jgi:mevalonate kinase